MNKNWKMIPYGKFNMPEKCYNCKGTGYDQCPRCFGRDKNCPDCNGKGLIDCPACRGKGYC